MGSRGSWKAGFVQEGAGLESLDEGDSMRLGWSVNSEAIMLLLSVLSWSGEQLGGQKTVHRHIGMTRLAGRGMAQLKSWVPAGKLNANVSFRFSSLPLTKPCRRDTSFFSC